MKLRPSSFIAAAIVAILSPLPGCSGDSDEPGAGGAGGSSGSTSSEVGSGGSVGVSSGSPAGSTSVSTSGVGGGSTSVSTSGVGGSTGSGSEVAPTFETVQFVIRAGCYGAGCHNKDEQNPLNLFVDEQLHARLTSYKPKNCGDIPLVNPGNPEESALIKILTGPCGATPRMPYECVNDGDSKCVPPDYIEAIAQWIADGAQE